MTLKVMLTYILVVVAMVPVHAMDGFRGTAKPFTLKRKPTVSRSGQNSGNNIPTKQPTVGDSDFPEELRYNLYLEGKGESDLHLVIDRTMSMPQSFQPDITGKFIRTAGNNSQSVAFYRDLNGHGHFACRRQTSSTGQSECELTALLVVEDEICFIGLGASHADCGTNDRGPLYLPEPEVRHRRNSHLNSGPVRTKRNILPASGFKTVEVAYVPDAKFTDLFYRRHPGDVDSAEAEMMMFFTLLTNEINVYYSTLVETSGGSLNIQLYPSAVALPGYQLNYFWSENFNDGTSLFVSESMKNNVEFVVNDSGFISGQFDFVYAITGFDLRDDVSRGAIVSTTFLNTICTTSRDKYAITEFTSWNFPRVLAHELGHALGAQHDDITSCPSGVNLMSQYLFSPNTTSKYTYHYFSTCSVASIIAHLASQPACLDDNDNTYNEFVDSFCQGLLGEQANSVDKQCERLTDYVGSTACDTVTENACYQPNLISCSDSNGDCTETLQYLWAFTPCATDKVCYKGSCVATFDICSTTSTTSTTSSSTSTSSTSITTPTTTTSTTTTTPTSTSSTTTTPSTTSTSSSTSTTSSTTTTSPTTTTSTSTPTTTSTTTSTTSSSTTTTTPTTTSSSTTTTPTTTTTTTPTTTSTTTTITPTTSTSTTTSSTASTSASTTTSTPSTTTSTTTSSTASTSPSTTTSTPSTSTSTTTSSTASTSPSTTTSTPSTTTSSTTSSTASTSPSTTTSTASTTTSSTTSSTPSTTSTISPTTTTTSTTARVPCSCCGFKRNKRRRRCCKTGLKKINAECYCCGSLKKVEAPPGWTGRRF